MKIALILLCSAFVIGCTSMKVESLKYNKADGTTLEIQGLEFVDIDPESIAGIIQAIGEGDID